MIKRSIFRTICLLFCLAPFAVSAAVVDFGLQVTAPGQQGGSGWSGAGLGTLGTLPPTVLPPPQSSCVSGPTDLNCDGVVNLQDVSILLAHFGENNPARTFDFNGDGKVNLADFSIMLYRYKK